MPRRRYFGTINSLGKDSSGVKMWRLRWHEQGQRKTETVHGSYSQAEKRLAAIHAAVDERKRSGATIGEIYERYYIPDAQRTKAPNSRENSASAWHAHVAARWADVPASRVKAADVEAWLNTLTYGMAKRAIAILRWCMRKAVMLEIIDVSPLEIQLALPESGTTQSRDILAGDDVPRYYAAVKGSAIEAAWILCIAGGLRSGESLGVMVGEVEYRTMDGVPFAAVPVNRGASRYGGLSIDDRTDDTRLKTRTSFRWAIIREPWASRLMELQDTARARGDTYLTEDGFGRPWGTAWLLRNAKRIYAAHNLQPITIRNLRASYATYAHHDLDLPTEDVARLMGHSQPSITWGVYERPNLDQIAAAVVRG